MSETDLVFELCRTETEHQALIEQEETRSKSKDEAVLDGIE